MKREKDLSFNTIIALKLKSDENFILACNNLITVEEYRKRQKVITNSVKEIEKGKRTK